MSFFEVLLGLKTVILQQLPRRPILIISFSSDSYCFTKLYSPYIP